MKYEMHRKSVSQAYYSVWALVEFNERNLARHEMQTAGADPFQGAGQPGMGHVQDRWEAYGVEG